MPPMNNAAAIKKRPTYSKYICYIVPAGADDALAFKYKQSHLRVQTIALRFWTIVALIGVKSQLGLR